MQAAYNYIVGGEKHIGNFVIDNLNSALATWNDKLSEIWSLITTAPEDFRGGAIWYTIISVNGALRAIAYALLTLFFVMGVMETCGFLFYRDTFAEETDRSMIMRRRIPQFFNCYCVLYQQK